MYTYSPLFFQVRGPLPVQLTPQVHLHRTPNRYVVEQGDSTSPQNHTYLCLAIETLTLHLISMERSGSVVECLTRDRGVVGSSLTGVTVLWSLSKTHLS